MKRGDVLIVAPASPFNKPRPALVVQGEDIEGGETVLIAPITSDLSWSRGLRIPIHPTAANGLRKPSEIMIDLIQPIRLERIGGVVGEVESQTLKHVDAGMRSLLGL